MSSNPESRRSFLKTSVAAAVAAAVPATSAASAQTTPQPPNPSAPPSSRPNIVLFLSDQFRADFIGAHGPDGPLTPNLNALAARGKHFTHAVCNQPLCSPSRAVLFTSRYATETGVWKIGLGMDQTLPTLATELHKAGYSTNLIGKWHLAPEYPKDGPGGSPGFVQPQWRAGFHDLWEGANALEHTSHPYYGTIWDSAGNEITYKDEYRVDFLTDRAERFLRQKHDKPFFLFLSQLEPHQQNDMHSPIGPTGSVKKFANPNAPLDLRAHPGTWQQQLPDYYGCISSIDNSVGRVRRILEEEGLADNTIFVFLSDHGCHFMTRNEEYKRSPHNASIRVPLLIDGPGFRGGAQQLPEIVGLIHITPTLLHAAGVPVPPSMKGRSILPLLNDPEARLAWPNKEYIQISESMTGRAIRTPDWTYCVADMTGNTKQPAAAVYTEYQMYDQRADPSELVNLAGRKEYRARAAELRAELKTMLLAAGETEPEIRPAPLYP